MDVTREQLASLINGKGIQITRGDLWGALQRIPPAGEFATRMGAAPYAQALLLSILAERECESCGRADNGGGYPCNCPVPCGARYCQHPKPEPDGGKGAHVPVEALAAWFREHKIPVSGHDMGGFTLGFTTAPEATAENILEDITGNAHPMPVDAHACCEHAGHADRELRAMAAIVAALDRNDWRKAFGDLLPLDLHERARAVRWLASRYPAPADDLPF